MGLLLTGDVHQTLAGASDQRFVDSSEAALAREYARLANLYGLKVTLFLTGRTVTDDSSDAEALLEMDNVEIGGHGWNAFHPPWRHNALARVSGSPHGPAWLQRRMIEQTCNVIGRWSRNKIVSWRNHAYQHDSNTARLLVEQGIRVWSDKVDFEQTRPRHDSNGIIILPINTLPDHEYLYHGARTPEAVAREQLGATYSPREWCDVVCRQAEAILADGGVATILAHPICMKVADDWQTFERLCKALADYPSLFARELASGGPVEEVSVGDKAE